MKGKRFELTRSSDERRETEGGSTKYVGKTGVKKRAGAYWKHNTYYE